MNQLLFDRSTGSLGASAFAQLQLSRRIRGIQLVLRQRFDGGENEEAHDADSQGYPGAHKSGVNALAVDIDGRMRV